MYTDKGQRQSLNNRHSQEIGVKSSSTNKQNIFRLSAEELKDMFEDANRPSMAQSNIKSNSHDLLYNVSFAEGLCKSLASNPESGIIGDLKDLKRRTKQFGKNDDAVQQQAKFTESLKETLDDKIFMYCAIAALLSIIVGTIKDPSDGWMDGFSIIITLLVIVLVQTKVDHYKDQRLVKLQKQLKTNVCNVYRGKKGVTIQLPYHDLVVGDIVELEAGMRVPADCVIVDGRDVVTDETFFAQEGQDERHFQDIHKDMFTMEQVQMRTQQPYGDPFLLAETYLVSGKCKAIVCCVGANTQRGLEGPKMDLDESTPLQTKLKNLTNTFTLFSIYAAIIIFLTTVTWNTIQVFVNGESIKDSSSKITFWLDKVVDAFTQSIIILIVAIPEGLPMTVGVSLAFSTKLMIRDNILVSALESPEKMAEINEIIVGKTGTLTVPEMKVEYLYFEHQFMVNSRKNTLLNCKLESQSLNNIVQGILYNSTAKVQIGDDCKWKIVGNETEKALFQLLQDAEIPIHNIIQQKEGNVLLEFPFDSIKKRTLTVVDISSEEDLVRIFIKGAPEHIIPACGGTFQPNGNIERFDNNQKQSVFNEIISEQIAKKGCKPIAFAYKDVQRSIFEQQRVQTKNFQSLQDKRNFLENQLNFVGVVGLKNEMRKNIVRTVTLADKAKTTIRVVSGDDFDVAVLAAFKAKIINQHEIDKEEVCMTATDFEDRLGPYSYVDDNKGGQRLVFDDQMHARKVVNSVKVITRAEPRHKELLVEALQELLHKKVTMTGQSINDVRAIVKADVGFCTADGQDYAKNCSQIVQTDNDLRSVLKAVFWGRNIFLSVRKFLQFQLTVNISCLLTVFIGTIILTESPISPSQLLWCNIVMDTFAAVALASERYPNSLIKPDKNDDQKTTREPQDDLEEALSENDEITSRKVFTPTMWRNIYGMSIYITLLCTFFIVFGKFFFSLDYKSTDDLDPSACPDNFDDDTDTSGSCDKTMHYTIIFNVFIWANLFNMFNCRRVDPQGFNIFENIMNQNYWFWIVFIVEIIIQIGITFWLNTLFETKLSSSHWFAETIFFGSSTIVFSIVLKLIPEKYYDSLQGWIMVDEDKDITEDDKLMQAYKQHAQGKIDPNMFKKQGGQQNMLEEAQDQYALNDSEDEGFPQIKN